MSRSLSRHKIAFIMRIAETIAHTLSSMNLTLATAESCTGGLLAGTLTGVSGASAFFQYGFITYADEAKMKILGVQTATLKKYGAVSGPTAAAMAQGAQKAAKADIAIAITGIAGPTGGTKHKPVGLVFTAASFRKTLLLKKHLFKGTRRQIRQQAVKESLSLILETLSI